MKTMKDVVYKKKCPYCKNPLTVPSWKICQSKLCAKQRAVIYKRKRRALKKKLK